MASSNRFQNRSAAFGQRLQEMWRNPSAVSALASLGLHGLFFVALPFLPYAALKATEPEIQNPVNVVELTPEEQKRLPDFSNTPPIELPPISQAPKPGSSDLFSLSNPPKAGSSSQSSESLLAPPLPIFVPPAPPTTQIPSFSIQIPKAPAIQPAPRQSALAPASPAPEPSQASRPTISPPAAEPQPLPSIAVESGPRSPQSDAQPDTVAQQPSPDTVAQQPSPTPRTQEQIRQNLIAEQQNLRELYAYNPSGTTIDNANSNFLSWYSQALGRDYAQGEQRPEQKEITAEYPKLACPLKQSRSAVVGVVVDADNKIVDNPEILQSSGYRIFNEEALRVVQNSSFENSSGDKQVRLIKVNFEYSEEICPPGLAPIAPAG